MENMKIFNCTGISVDMRHFSWKPEKLWLSVPSFLVEVFGEKLALFFTENVAEIFITFPVLV
jgi:hypothetical protein